jgi:predicted HAD superfamily Cof-like phosphohydrolase
MTEKTQDIIDRIFDFNEQVIGTGDVELNALTEKQHNWTQTFVAEEAKELAEAFAEQDIVKMVDAVGDLIYGAMGTFKKMGLTREHVHAVFLAIHNANMTKKRGDKGRGSDEDAVKPADFVPPEEAIADILFLE